MRGWVRVTPTQSLSAPGNGASLVCRPRSPLGLQVMQTTPEGECTPGRVRGVGSSDCGHAYGPRAHTVA